MLTGSMAVNYYGVPRMTRDIDLVIEVGAGDAHRLSSLFQEDFYIDPETVRRAIEERTMFNIIHIASVIKGGDVAIVAPEDLVISKLDWARDTHSEIHLTDVRNVLASVPEIDRTYLASWIERLGLGLLYREVEP
ncbi:MAG: hypothetical protein HY216_09085 [Candidatus Rokubacteria bacterium]|nr:hypothetical protein [Candidatus Rokubacteria bacterium]